MEIIERWMTVIVIVLPALAILAFLVFAALTDAGSRPGSWLLRLRDELLVLPGGVPAYAALASAWATDFDTTPAYAWALGSAAVWALVWYSLPLTRRAAARFRSRYPAQ